MLRFVFVVLAVLVLAGCGGDGDDQEVMRDSEDQEAIPDGDDEEAMPDGEEKAVVPYDDDEEAAPGGDDEEVMRDDDEAVVPGNQEAMPDGDDEEAMPDSAETEGTPVEGHATPAERWWNALTAGQMVAALYGNDATDEQAAAAEMVYAELDEDTRLLVDAALETIYDKAATYDSIGDWWQTLGCVPMRVAAGDGNTFDAASPYCTYYPGYEMSKVLTPASLQHVNAIGAALLDYPDMPSYTPDDMAAFDELVEGMTAVFTLDVPRDGETVFKLAFTAPGEAHSPDSPGESVDYTWEHLSDETDSGRLTVWWDPDDPEAYEIVFLGMRDGVFWVSGESVYVGTGVFEITDEDAN